MTDLSLEQLRRLGREAGLDVIGATTADPFPELADRLHSYAERGRTGYEHAVVEDRIHPERWMPGVKSLIAAAMPYLTEAGKELAKRHPAGGGHGVVTVYSYGEDYHRVLQRRLEALAASIEAEIGRPFARKVSVDTSPLVDRRVAERAGIGWVAKNCMFYTEKYGSFVFIGILGVDLEVETNDLQANDKFAAGCGDCDLCLRACPTGALVAPGVIDATRCLSYITQMKGIIPREYRKALGRRVWGCDTCQWACPINRDASASPHVEYLPQGELEHPDLLAILELTNRQFLRLYGHTAAAWRGLRTWQRNALIALGNSRRQDAIPHIVPFLSHPRPELRASAAWALEQLGGEAARAAVAQAYEREADEQVRADMAWAIGKGEDS
ncbi:tRNA epoxyqueuosine(34) reductase QueG [Alicyclobacillus contaminans]|uniref:tRNA epoxyqueuosine(34) reductase QueG n=1 Tax=Alicyclobacillus contaminans TaxID=392016 RepID=UPI000400E2D7|nr:tRNA epoxyqueuosine(34) reductase QueG [Alicyclobacillus contaminans]